MAIEQIEENIIGKLYLQDNQIDSNLKKLINSI